MATGTGKIYQIYDGSTAIFPRTVTSAVYGLDTAISTAKSEAISSATAAAATSAASLYVSLSGAQTITGAKTFTGAILSIKYDNPRIGFYMANGTLNGVIAYRDTVGPEIYTGSAWYRMYHSGNSNKSDVAWACSTLTASGGATIAGAVGIGKDPGSGISLDVNGAIRGAGVVRFMNMDYTQDAGYVGRTAGGNNNIYLRSNLSADVMLYTGSAIATWTATGVFSLSSGGVSSNVSLKFMGGNANRAMILRTSINQYNHPEKLDFIVTDTSETIIATLTRNGSFTTTGDQVISSDERLKTNIKPVELTVEQIAGMRAVTYDRKDSELHSLGVIAQDWEKVLPESVYQGEYLTFKYAQTAMVSAIILAKHETEQDKEIARLKDRVRDLEKQLNIS